MPILQAPHQQIAPSAKIADDVHIQAETLTIGEHVHIGAGTRIIGKHITIADDVYLAHDVVLGAENIHLGQGCRVEERTRISGFGGHSMTQLTLGDFALVSADNRILTTYFVIGDYVKIHNHTLINGMGRCVIGHNTWVGQNNIINAESDLFIGNNVCMGVYTNTWTHAFYGDLLEGSRIFNIQPTRIEDDAWVMGSYDVITAGVTVGKKALILANSTVTKDVPENTVWGGSPAQDMTAKLGAPFRHVPVEEKYAKMQRYAEQFVANYDAESVANGYRVRAPWGEFALEWHPVWQERAESDNMPRIILTQAVEANHATEAPHTTVIDLSQRTYSKRRTRAEVAWLRFLLTYRGRFLPAHQAHITLPEDHAHPRRIALDDTLDLSR
jgi:acetyltransferase-like isoleucine patch superfamily enzyme